ncbi:FKBP-type peptidyl-prolyl cis-trans isomerase [Glutamicibacter sp. MNS18]|uniref:FKBP-type peptidyl-prolyl cis-trans isomerase n=1 Tax=Glutamicibacter sp. MNS18 TaxID=2989817 RepID=UPI00223587D9|nr:FKBP-type peptidyl-prolyl cis-trans isomerase [Glutamicibacter sp. MNS18]MCW4464893.1 FKBP-type peptidyl-prolyl cis-trans isomerase [Glutamicibacter sp. MNS18]
MRKVLAASALASILALAACGSGSGGALSDIEVKPGADENSEPSVQIDAPLLTEKSEAVVLIDGEGEQISEGQNITLKSGIYKNIDGLQTDANFTGAAVPMTVDAAMKEQMPELYDVLLKAKVGAWIAYTTVDGTPNPDGSTAEPVDGARAERVIVLNVQSASSPSSALGDEEVSELKDSGKLPSVDTSGDEPTISIPEDTDAPAGLAIDVLEEGDGEVATETSDVEAFYTGVRWEDGEVFDGNFDSDSAAAFNLQGVIKGWTQGLSGLKEGSKVLLSIPSDLAYGEDESSGRPTGPLVFYVELTKVSNAE